MIKRMTVIGLVAFIFSDLTLLAANGNFKPSETSNSVTNNFQDPKAKKPATTKPAAKAPSKAPAAKSSAASFEKGKNLIAQSDCLACHKTDEKLIGPAYKEVASKYPATKANVDLLVSKVINGGAGNWGQIPMSPHAGLSKEDASEMVKYILSLKAK